MLSHFAGVILGRTTVAELANLGDRTSAIDPTTGKPYERYEVGPNRLRVSYTGNTCDKAYVTRFEGMPEEWAGAGFDWRLSYNGWLQLLEDLGFRVRMTDPPHTVSFQDRECLSAKVVGTKEEDLGTVECELLFKFGEKGAGVDDKATLYRITAKWVGPTMEARGSATGHGLQEPSPIVVTEGNASGPSAQSGTPLPINGAAETPMLSHFCGIILGKTTVSELQLLGDRSSYTDPATGAPFQCYEVGPHRLNCWYVGNVCEHVYITKREPMPEEWTKAGFDWRLSYSNWLQLFDRLGVAVVIKDPPHTVPFQTCVMTVATDLSKNGLLLPGLWKTVDSLAALVVGTREEDVGNVEFTFNFNYGEKGAGVDDKATLYSIAAKWLGK
jgi:hypothetical protein